MGITGEVSGLCHAGGAERIPISLEMCGASCIDAECCYECFMSDVGISQGTGVEYVILITLIDV